MKAFRLALAAAGLALLPAALPTLNAQTRPTEEFPKEKAYIRRISIGAKGVVHAAPRLRTGDDSSSVGDSSTLRTTGEVSSSRFAYGPTVQLMVTDKFGVALDLLIRKESYSNSSTLATVVTDPFTLRSRTEVITFDEQSRGDIWEIPFVVRYYKQGRRKQGIRTFLEGGVAIRNVRNVRSLRFDTEVDGDLNCCDETPIPPATQNARGAVIGAGLHATDDFGIAVIPQVRYTRWLSRTWDSRPTRSSLNTVEISIAIMF